MHAHPQGVGRSRQTWFLDVERGALRLLVEGEPARACSDFGDVIRAWHRRE